MKIDPETLYHQLKNLLATVPDLGGSGWTTIEARQWLGRASALVEADGNLAEIAHFVVATNSLGTVTHASHVQTILSILYRAWARAELAAPAAVHGSFIPVGAAFSALAAVSKILGTAKRSVMIVDPYADANLLTEFAILAPEGTQVHVLADQEHHKPGLKPAAESWSRQYSSTRPLEVRLSSARSLHDRLILVDGSDAWTVGQSFNALAKRAPTSLVRADSDTSQMKVEAYLQTWASAAPLA